MGLGRWDLGFMGVMGFPGSVSKQNHPETLNATLLHAKMLNPKPYTLNPKHPAS